MTFDPTRWTRLPVGATAIWLCPDRPAWFVPTAAGDRLLQKLAAGGADNTLETAAFLQRLPDPPADRYPGRAFLLPGTPPLRELWLHITDRCNLACSHCLFSSGPDAARELSTAQLTQHLDDAASQGCRTFALTGGEPLVHHGFIPLIDHILNIAESRIAILTNGLLLEKRLQPHWPRERLHLQISLDGRPDHHDSLRGVGSFVQLEQQLVWLRNNNWRFTLSCCVTRDNADDLPWLVDYAADHGAAALHLMWHFIRGRGSADQHLAPPELLNPVLDAMRQAEVRGITIDNIESLKGQIFSPPGTIHDGSSAGWEAAAIGPDNRLYPSAATVGIAELGTTLESGLPAAWQGSPVLSRIRQSSVTNLADPWRYLLGGGDLDHSYHHCATYIGNDPYQPLLEQLALQLIAQAAARLPEPSGPAVRLKMGELLVSCGSHGPVAVCHTNCLLSLDEPTDSRGEVGAYYATAAGDKRSEILNPVHYDVDLIEHIPAAYRFRGYGCGSPVMDAGIMPGERVVDLGCGGGVECFIAARLVGSHGSVTGIDMLEPMLELARKGALEVRQSLGYDNLSFQKGYLEELPLPDNDANLVVSNCVLNLSSDKRCTFAEILRVLAPGGRLVAADVVCETEPDAEILNDETLRGECISGAMVQKDLLGILEESGFTGFRVITRLPYRIVNGHPFFSLTFTANKAAILKPESVRVFYPGPAKGLFTPGGLWLRPGQTGMISQNDADLLGDQIWRLDERGFVTNVAIAAGANCSIPPEAKAAPLQSPKTSHADGCLVCGAPLVYHTTEVETACHFCGKVLPANACCLQGHFVCDSCHTGDALELIEHLCGATLETDPISLFQEIRKHPSIPLHGPQYHALVPGVLLACLRNAGKPVTGGQLRSAIQRGGEISGGSCGFWGVCGAATGAGIAFSVLLEATPLKATARQTVQNIVQQVLAEIAGHEAARCCQRDCWIALRSGMTIACELWSLDLPAVEPFACSQMARNKECLGVSCPLWP
ncbi:MAG: methyltransferase domain-containing protein [Deltaproteobacteria bacterium]|nr:methyltransferase domain-containing protein [Deltaproteobacteria bacterium]